jgi:hypothetical protein
MGQTRQSTGWSFGKPALSLNPPIRRTPATPTNGISKLAFESLGPVLPLHVTGPEAPGIKAGTGGLIRCKRARVVWPVALASFRYQELIRAWLVYFLSFFGLAKRLLRFHREEFEIRKSVPPVKSMAKKVQIEFTS